MDEALDRDSRVSFGTWSTPYGASTRRTGCAFTRSNALFVPLSDILHTQPHHHNTNPPIRG